MISNNGYFFSNSIYVEGGKSYNHCMMPHKISGKMHDLHDSLYTLLNIIQSLYDGNTFVCVTFSYNSIISSHARC